MSAPHALRAALAAAALAGAVSSGLAASAKAPPRATAPKQAAPKPVSGGAASFTADQAWQGRFGYIARCAQCHGGDLHGYFGPALQGPDSNVPWQTPKQVWTYMTVHMPAGDAGALPQKQYLEIMAYLMQSSGRRAGRAALTPAAIAADPAALDEAH